MLASSNFHPKLEPGRRKPQRFAYPRILEINKAGVGYAFQMWPSPASLMGSIYTSTDTSSTFTCLKPPHILLMVKLNPRFGKDHEMNLYPGRLFWQIQLLRREGRVSLSSFSSSFSSSSSSRKSIPLKEEGRVSSQRILIEDALRPRAFPHCSYIHTLLRMHCNVTSHNAPGRYILLNSIKPFYTGSSPPGFLHIFRTQRKELPVNRNSRTSAK